MNPKFLNNMKWAKKHNLGPKEMSKKDKKANKLKAVKEYIQRKNEIMSREFDKNLGIKAKRLIKAQITPIGRNMPVFKPLTLDDIPKDKQRWIALSPEQKQAKKWKFISPTDRKREQLYGGTRLLQIKKILRSRYKLDLARRAALAKKTTVPSSNYVKFWPRQVLGIRKEFKKSHKQHLVDLARVKKFRKNAKDARRAGRSDKPKDTKKDKKKEKSKAGAKEKPKAEKPKTEKAKAKK